MITGTVTSVKSSLQRAGLVAGVAAITLLSACGRSAADYRKAAVKAIGGADAERIIGHGFSKIYCETPSNTSKGSTFSCAAKADDGNNYSFTATIVSSSRVEITDYEVVEPTTDSVPADTTA